MHLQEVSPRAVQPREDDNFVSCSDAVKRVEKSWLEDEPGIGRSLIALSRGDRRIGQRGFNLPNYLDLVGALSHSHLL
jgi:hypothetical protein